MPRFSAPRSLATAALLLAAAAALVPGAAAHAYLAMPISRNLLANSDFCPHCLNAGRQVTISDGGKLTWPEGKHGMCGDPWNAARRHEAGGEFATGAVTATYAEGSNIEIAVAMSTYHKGAVQYRVCRFPADADEKAALTEACLDAHVLKQAEVAGAQAPGSAYFFMGNGNDQYYSPPREYAATYTLPAGLSCDGAAAKCVLQMYYVTGNTCSPPFIPASYRDSTLPECGTPGAGYPEEFFNCADIAIAGSGAEFAVKSGRRLKLA